MTAKGIMREIRKLGSFDRSSLFKELLETYCFVNESANEVPCPRRVEACKEHCAERVVR